jgi:hypothetical protein
MRLLLDTHVLLALIERRMASLPGRMAAKCFGRDITGSSRAHIMRRYRRCRLG